MAIIRLLEPHVYNNFKKDLKWLLNKIRFKCCRTKKKSNFCFTIKETKISKESLQSFANSIMNVEFVYLILLGINNFMDNISTSNNKRMNKIQIIKDNHETKIVLPDIHIQNL